MDALRLGFLSPNSWSFPCVAPASGLVLVVASLLAACGGGDGSRLQNQKQPWTAGQFSPAKSYENKCAAPRQGVSPITNEPYPDRKGSLLDENNFLRSWSNETYLWYSEIVDRNPAFYSATDAYFSVLKTTARTSSGNAKDKFHFTYPTAEWEKSTAGFSFGYGMEYALLSAVPPRDIRVAYVHPGSPAATKNVARGAQIVKIDGIDVESDNSVAGVAVLNEALFPSQTAAHTFTLRRPGETTTFEVVLLAGDVTSVPVPVVKTLASDTGKVGYIAFHDHAVDSAEKGLRDAIAQLQGESVDDLVLDLRYNGGGYLAIASQLAYMIAGQSATEGKTFELMQFNDKWPNRNPVTNEPLGPEPFYNTGLGFSVTEGEALPSLNLSRVYVLTSNNTCSASEALMNSLRGINVEVIQIGETTCGKPYGFYPQPNCGTTYFTVQFRGVNAKNYGDYNDGFVPSASDNGKDQVLGCTVADDLDRELGNVSEARLAAALYHRTHGACPSSATAGIARQGAPQRVELVKPDVLKTAWRLPAGAR